MAASQITVRRVPESRLYAGSPRTDAESGSARLAKPEHEAVRAVADAFLVHLAGAGVLGVLEDVALGLEPEARFGHLRDDRALLDAVDAVAVLEAAARPRMMVDQGLDLGAMVTRSDLANGFRYALSRTRGRAERRG